MISNLIDTQLALYRKKMYGRALARIKKGGFPESIIKDYIKTIEKEESFLRDFMLAVEQEVKKEIMEQLKPALDDFSGVGKKMIQSKIFENTGNELIENVGYIKSCLLLSGRSKG